MVAYSFKKRFAQPILDETKIHTCRGERKRHAREGDELQLYTGMRTKHCLLIARRTCAGVLSISLDLEEAKVRLQRGQLFVYVNPHRFAINDGFQDWDDFKAFWEKEHPGLRYWGGHLIAWSPFCLSTLERTDQW